MNLISRVNRLEGTVNPLGKNPVITVIIDDICGRPTAEDIEAARQLAIKECRPVCIVQGGEADEP